MIITLVFEKNANFFAENCRKSQKIVIITSTPGPRQSTQLPEKLYVHHLVSYFFYSLVCSPRFASRAMNKMKL
jgi:hypothetical protein